MEIAYRMQTEAPEVFDIRKESDATAERYGDSDFARGCLMALRLVEHGVRMVQVYFAGRSSGTITTISSSTAAWPCTPTVPWRRSSRTLRRAGCLTKPSSFCAPEFGRTPVNQTSARIKVHNGRDHNPYGFTVLLAGGGFRGGVARPDGRLRLFRVVKVHVHDLHATILHLLGLDHTKLTYRTAGAISA